jgi:hypothetical protein
MCAAYTVTSDPAKCAPDATRDVTRLDTTAVQAVQLVELLRESVELGIPARVYVGMGRALVAALQWKGTRS